MARIINVLRIQGPPERVMEVWESSNGRPSALIWVEQRTDKLITC